MKKFTQTLLVLLLVNFLNAQELHGTRKEHLTFGDTFFGTEDNYQVCYPKQHRTFFYGIFIASGIASAFLGIIIYMKSKHNKSLKVINTEIKEKNREIVDSITYAKRIQESILPSAEYLSKNAPNLHVLYKPRDIVSGDLYWAHKNEHGLFVAIIDCTGHGVPGAFLSLLAHNAIEHAVKERKIVETSLILETMNDYVKSALKQGKSEELKDGMEIGLYRIKGTDLYYSGANIRLEYTSKGEIKVIKPTKCTVGSVQPHVVGPPQQHHVKLEKGDRVYMRTDGIVDQFGGSSSKKFTAKQLVEIISQTLSQNVSNQLKEIEKRFIDWKGSNEQTDDVLLAIYEI